MPTKPYDKGSANDSVPALTDSEGVSYPVGGIAYGTEGGTVTIVSAAGLPVQAGSGAAFPVTDNGGSLTVDGTVAVSGSVAVTGPLTDTQLRASAVPVSLTSTTITGTVAATQSGTWTVTGSGGTFPVTDSGGSLTVDAPVGTPVFVMFSNGTNSVPYVTLDGAGFVAQANATPAIAAVSYGWDSSLETHTPIPISNGSVIATVNDGGGSITVDGTVAVSSVSGSVAVTGTFWQATQPVSLASVPSHDVTNAGTFAVQVSSALPAGTNAIGKLAANSGVTIGAVEIAATQTLSTVTTVGTVTTLTGGGVAHDSADSGNPVKVGARATTSLAGLTLVANADRTDMFAGVDGVQITRPHCNLEDIVSGVQAITYGSSTSVIASQGAGVKTYITTVIIANTSATAVTVDLRDGTGGTVKATFPVPANTSGVVCNLPIPLPFSAATAVAADPSAAASTVTVTLIGFKSKV